MHLSSGSNIQLLNSKTHWKQEVTAYMEWRLEERYGWPVPTADIKICMHDFLYKNLHFTKELKDRSGYAGGNKM